MACGLCCQGLRHKYAALETDEIPWAERFDLGLHPGDGAPTEGFTLPCMLHQNGSCWAYKTRPGACSSYRCGLLRAYLQNQISMDDARSIVADTKDLIDTIQLSIGHTNSPSSIWQQKADFLAGQGANRETAAGRHVHAELLLAEQQLAFICRHFEKPEDAQLAPEHRPRAKVVQKAMQSARQRSWKPSAHVRHSERGSDMVIVDLSTGVTSALHGVSADMWLALMAHENLDDVMEALLAQYEIDEKTLREDLWGFVEELAARGVLVSEPLTAL